VSQCLDGNAFFVKDGTAVNGGTVSSVLIRVHLRSSAVKLLTEESLTADERRCTPIKFKP
jgi:hypothetical protein